MASAASLKIERVRPSGSQIDEVVSRILLGDGLGLIQDADGVARLMSGAWLEVRADTDAAVDGSTNDEAAINDALDWLKTQRSGGILLHRYGTMRAGRILLPSNTGIIGSGWGTVIKQTDQQHTQVDTGTSSGSNTSTTLNDTSKAWTVDGYIGNTVKITGGTGSGQVRFISDNTATQLTVDEAWATTPDATSTYEILQPKALIELEQSTSEFAMIWNLQVDGNKANQTAYNPLIRLVNTDGGPTAFDTHHLIERIFARNAKGSALSIGKNVRELRVIASFFDACDRHAKETEFEGGTDNWFAHCTASNMGLSGWNANGTADHYSVVKAFANGVRAISGNRAGFLISQPTYMSIPQAQENPEGGFRLLNTFACVVRGLIADANAGTAVLLDNTFDCQIDGIVRSQASLAHQTTWALDSTNGSDRNHIDLNVRASELLGGLFPSSAHRGNDNQWHINSRFFGRWWALRGTAASSTDDHLIFGKEGAPAASNPRWAWRTGARSVPEAILVGDDATTVKDFLEARFDDHDLLLGYSGGPPFGSVIFRAGTVRPNAASGAQLGTSSIPFASGYFAGAVSNKYGSSGQDKEYFTFGRSGSPASGNPYFTHKINSSDEYELGSWDGATARTFLRASHSADRLIVPGAFRVDGNVGFFAVGPTARQTVNAQAAYTSDGEGTAYTGIDNAQAGTVYAQVADLNALRTAYENLRGGYDDTRGIVANLRQALQNYGLLT